MSTYQTLYAQIKNLESVFKVPADYVTIDVGTFDAATGKFSGLVTRSDTDPEPVAHGPKDKPTNPAPHYQGELWISVTIDKNWRRTITTTPAPKVGLAPVLLKFSVKNHQNAAWSVTVGGQQASVPAGQSTVLFNIWDLPSANWQIAVGGKTYSDRIMLQRQGDPLVGVGAFTVPALPLSIVYAPPADAAKASKVVYSVSEIVGSTSTFEVNSDSSVAHPWLPQNLSDLKTFQTLLGTLATVMGKIQNVYAQAIGTACSTIASGIGTLSGIETAGTVDNYNNTVTLTESKTQAVSAQASNGGPGGGDVINYLRDAKFAWVMSGGRLRLCLLGGTHAFYTAAYLRQHKADTQLTGLPQDVAEMLLGLDPFVAGGPSVQLLPPRFKDISALLQGPIEYGGGITISGLYSQTYTVSETRTSTSYKSTMSDFNAGWLAKVLGTQAQTLKTATNVSHAAGTTHTDTQTFSWELHSGSDEHFIVEFWLDQVFGTLALRQQALSGKPRLAGLAKGLRGRPLIRKPVVLTIDGKTFRTMTGPDGHYAFYSKAIPAGQGMVQIGDELPHAVQIGPKVIGPRYLE